ncbi:MAG: hypothetical protein LIO78_07720 [Clostridiales bacterium]|nr:hypothetical protein [Clostridiales bacterium]
MNKHRITLLLSACVTALNLTLAAALISQAKSADLSPASAALVSAEAEAEGDGSSYLLLAVDGKVCVYQDGTLLLRTGIDVALLPAADRADLAAGIYAEDAFALAAYLEDFGA